MLKIEYLEITLKNKDLLIISLKMYLHKNPAMLEVIQHCSLKKTVQRYPPKIFKNHWKFEEQPSGNW